MAISNSGIFSGDVYDGQRYYSEQERRYREEMERQRMMAQQNAYNPYFQSTHVMTDIERQQQAVNPKTDDRFTTNKKLLLLENRS